MEILKDDNQNFIKATNPFENFSKIDNGVLAFYLKFNQLKNLYRQGWLKVRIGLEHKDKCESIADHSFSVALLALTIIEQNHLALDVLKCLKMSIIHELGEVYAGDYTPYDTVTREEKYLAEKEAVREILDTLDEDNDLFELWQEYEKAETNEAKFVKNVDSLEFLLQACAYGYDVKYFERSLGRITDPYCKEIIDSAISASAGNKKPKVVG